MGAVRHGGGPTRTLPAWLIAAGFGVPLALADPPAPGAPLPSAAVTQAPASDAPAAATTATDGPTPVPQVLGVAEGALSYCSPIDPEAAAGLRQLIGQMTQGTSERRLAEVRDSDEYRKAYDSVLDFTAKIEGPRNARRFCSGEAGGRD